MLFSTVTELNYVNLENSHYPPPRKFAPISIHSLSSSLFTATEHGNLSSISSNLPILDILYK